MEQNERPRSEPTIARPGYEAIADVYHRTRPGYPRELVSMVLAHARVGADDATRRSCGYGAFSRLLAERGLRVVAVEPLAAMRAQAPPMAGVAWIEGRFERTSLADRSQHWVVSAQAFHQSDIRRALPEIHRVLKPGGLFTAVWNAPFILERQAIDEITVPYVSRRLVGSGPSMRRHVADRRSLHRDVLGRLHRERRRRAFAIAQTCMSA